MLVTGSFVPFAVLVMGITHIPHIPNVNLKQPLPSSTYSTDENQCDPSSY